MSGTTTSFSDGSVTLSGFDTIFINSNGDHSFLTPLGTSFDFNFGAGATDSLGGGTAGAEPAQIISGTGSGSADLQLTLTGVSAIPTTTNAELIWNGQTITDGVGTIDFGTASAGQLAIDLRQLQVVDNTGGVLDSFTINFTLDDGSGPTTTWNEVFTVACYGAGTRIATPTGETAVEDLQIGDLVLTASGATKPVKWLGRRSYSGDKVAAHPQLRPVLIRQDALGSGLPRRDLMVSPMHSLYLDDSFIPASALVNGVSIVRPECSGAVEYIHIELHDHDVVLAEGVAAETFVDDDSRTMFDNVSEYYDLYGFADSRRGYSVPRLEEGYRLEALRRRIAARAGMAPSAVVPGTMQGHVERLSAGELEGWVMDRANPANPIELEVLIDGEIVATVLANRYRPDLDRAGLADGRCAFSVAMPASAESLSQVTVRRASDGGQVAVPVTTRVTA